MNITRGAILWAAAPDRNGYVKDRPMIVVAFDDADPSAPLICCCITSKDKTPRPKQYLRLPWDASGKSSTRLIKPSFAVADWLIEIDKSKVRRFGGMLNTRQFQQLLDLIATFAR